MNNIDAIKTLVKNNAKIDAIDSDGMTALHLAVRSREIQMVKILNDLKADINKRDDNGNTPLHIATAQKDTNMVRILLELGADVTIENKEKTTPLQLATLKKMKLYSKINNNQIYTLFLKGNLVGRTANIEIELLNAHTKRKYGHHINVEQDGHRNKSATILVPDVEINLWNAASNSGLLYDSDKLTIKAYMLRDGNTNSSRIAEDFYNINDEKNEFAPTLSKKDFIEKYKEYTASSKFTKTFSHNEVLANLYPEALVGISTNGNITTKIKALEAKYYVSERYGYDLPMVIVGDGKVMAWNPTLTEIKELLSKEYEVNYKKEKPNPIKLGFMVDKNGEIGLLNKNEVTVQEISGRGGI